MGIAKHAGIWSSSCEVFIHEIFNDEIAKFLPDIQDIMSETMFHCSLSRIVKAVHIAATGFLLATTTAAIVPCFHGYTHDFIALIVEHQRSYGAVNPTAHRH